MTWEQTRIQIVFNISQKSSKLTEKAHKSIGETLLFSRGNGKKILEWIYRELKAITVVILIKMFKTQATLEIHSISLPKACGKL